MIIPPFAGVMLVDYRDRMELTPYEWVREFIGVGRFNAKDVGPQPGEDLHPLFKAAMGEGEIWVIATWRRFEDGREEPLRVEYLDPGATEEDARKAFENAEKFGNLSKDELEGLAKCLLPSEDDLAYIEGRFPGVQRDASSTGSIDERDLYQARLKVLAGMQPKTVEIIQRADATTDPQLKGQIEREAVQAYFADLAHHWTEDQVKEWQRNNPIGTEWMCHFARVFAEPERGTDPINYELALRLAHKCVPTHGAGF